MVNTIKAGEGYPIGDLGWKGSVGVYGGCLQVWIYMHGGRIHVCTINHTMSLQYTVREPNGMMYPKDYVG